jgi:hypothetical protein
MKTKWVYIVARTFDATPAKSINVFESCADAVYRVSEIMGGTAEDIVPGSVFNFVGPSGDERIEFLKVPVHPDSRRTKRAAATT